MAATVSNKAALCQRPVIGGIWEHFSLFEHIKTFLVQEQLRLGVIASPSKWRREGGQPRMRGTKRITSSRNSVFKEEVYQLGWMAAPFVLAKR